MLLYPEHVLVLVDCLIFHQWPNGYQAIPWGSLSFPCHALKRPWPKTFNSCLLQNVLRCICATQFTDHFKFQHSPCGASGPLPVPCDRLPNRSGFACHPGALEGGIKRWNGQVCTFSLKIGVLLWILKDWSAMAKISGCNIMYYIYTHVHMQAWIYTLLTVIWPFLSPTGHPVRFWIHRGTARCTTDTAMTIQSHQRWPAMTTPIVIARSWKSPSTNHTQRTNTSIIYLCLTINYFQSFGMINNDEPWFLGIITSIIHDESFFIGHWHNSFFGKSPPVWTKGTW